MYAKLFQNFNMPYLPTLALLLFLGLFIGILFWTFSAKTRTIIKQVQNLPLEEGENNE